MRKKCKKVLDYFADLCENITKWGLDSRDSYNQADPEPSDVNFYN